MKHIDAATISELERALKAEQKTLEEELSAHGEKKAGDWQGTATGFNGGESDTVDAADAMEELATNVPLVEELESRLKDVRDALKKITEGTYGICEKTRKEIPLERLRANPAARTVV